MDGHAPVIIHLLFLGHMKNLMDLILTVKSKTVEDIKTSEKGFIQDLTIYNFVKALLKLSYCCP